MKKLLIILALSASASTAMAADVASKPTYNWSGFYAGIHGGFGQSDFGGIFDEAGTAPNASFGTFDVSGALIGAQVGYNYDLGGIIVGVEADYSATSFEDSFTDGEDDVQTLQTDVFATLRGRLGTASGPFFAYVTAGVGYTESTLTVENGDDSLTFTDFGPVYGAGLEYAVNSRFSIKGEWLRFAADRNFPSTDQLDSGTGALDELNDGDDDDHLSFSGSDIFRVGLNYRFGGPGAPTAASAEATDFSGFNMAAYGGFGIADVIGQFDGAGSEFDLRDLNVSGGSLGIGAGYAMQFGSLVVGLDADYTFSDVLGSAVDSENDRQTVRINDYGTVRGRVGVASGDLLVYGTAGIAFSSFDFIVEDGADVLNQATTGIVYGGGVEYAVSERFSIRAEALRLDFNDSVAGGPGSVLDDLSDGDDEDSFAFGGLNTVRAGLVVRF
ncbi:MAG: outer membrane beta-barrel protein [Pseudomonadota bacterium]